MVRNAGLQSEGLLRDSTPGGARHLSKSGGPDSPLRGRKRGRACTLKNSNARTHHGGNGVRWSAEHARRRRPPRRRLAATRTSLAYGSPGIHPKLWRKSGERPLRRGKYPAADLWEHRPGAGLCINDRYAPFDFSDCPAACRRGDAPGLRVYNGGLFPRDPGKSGQSGVPKARSRGKPL